MAVKPIPEGYRTVTPYLAVRGLPKLLEFVRETFDAKIIHVMDGPDGKPGHAEFEIGDSKLMAGEASGKWPPVGCSLYLYVPDTDAVYRKALAAGAESVMEPTNQFYGDRNAGVKDEHGIWWWIGTHIEDVSPEELQRRAAARK
ncbi:MAG TPA: VOC family protein [Gemmataceae bacterium]|nr:VOC family protein [Gemmataceae bacterium]